MSIWKLSLVFNDVYTGLGWSITTFRDAASPTACQTAADAWLDKYFACCHNTAKLLQLRVSDPASPGTYEIFDGASFIHNNGVLATGMMPIAECALAQGDTAGPIDLNHARWHLHGFDISQFDTNGVLDEGLATVIALKNASLAFLLNYRKVATPVHHWPVVTPPTAFVVMRVKGPYVRRVGGAFFRPGQHQRFKT